MDAFGEASTEAPQPLPARLLPPVQPFLMRLVSSVTWL